MKAYVSLSRPRFWQSKVSGRNLRLHPRGVRQGQLAPMLGRSNSRLNVARVDDMGPLKVRLRACLNDYYQISLRGQPAPMIESRADIVLHRAGLTNSILQGRQRILHGHVYMIDGPGRTAQRVRSGSMSVREGMLLGIDSSVWAKQRLVSSAQWRNRQSQDASTSRSMVPYLESDYVNGTVVMVSQPTRSTILLPPGLGTLSAT